MKSCEDLGRRPGLFDRGNIVVKYCFFEIEAEYVDIFIVFVYTLDTQMIHI